MYSYLFIFKLVLTGFETNNKYVIKNSLGQKVFFAAEDSSCCQRCFCSNIRDFQLAIIDNFGHEVIHLNKSFACCILPVETINNE